MCGKIQVAYIYTIFSLHLLLLENKPWKSALELLANSSYTIKKRERERKGHD